MERKSFQLLREVKKRNIAVFRSGGYSGCPLHFVKYFFAFFKGFSAFDICSYLVRINHIGVQNDSEEEVWLKKEHNVTRRLPF